MGAGDPQPDGAAQADGSGQQDGAGAGAHVGAGGGHAGCCSTQQLRYRLAAVAFHFVS